MSDETPDGEHPQFGSFRADAATSRTNARDGEQLYETADGEESSDEIDPKKLVRTPSVNDIRWYYRNGPFADTLVDKPVQDAFKYGVSYTGDDGTVDEMMSDAVIDAFREGHKKARRDGFALLWFRLRDTAHEWEPPENVHGLHEVKVLTLDDLTTAKPLAFEEKLSAANKDNFDHEVSANTDLISGVSTFSDLIERAEGDSDLLHDSTAPLRAQTDSPRRLLRKTDGDTVRPELATDMLNDPDIDPEELRGVMPYGRSRFYDTSDNGIVFSNRLDDTRFESPLGYLYDRGASFNPMLLHHSRVYHLTWNGEVDGDVDDWHTFGGYEGDSVLRSVIHLLRTIHKSNWAVGQTLFRDSSPLRVLSYESGVGEDAVDEGERAVSGMNAKSFVTMPPGFELDVQQPDGDSPIEPAYDVLFKQLCAGTEMTNSVLFGSQSGTVSGEETNIKNYFNQVERLRHTRFSQELAEIANWYGGVDAGSDGIDYAIETPVDPELFDWGPLFRISELDRAEAMARHVQLVTQATTNFVMTPDEARSFLNEQWAEWTDMDITDAAPVDPEELFALQTDIEDDDMSGNPAVGQNGGGREQGETGDSSQPTTQ